MTLEDYIKKVDMRVPLAKASSFVDYTWRQQAKAVSLKPIEGKIEGVPAEARKEFLVSSDALYMLSVFKAFKKPASITEFVDVIKGLNNSWVVDPYAVFHLKMYATSFVHLQLFKGVVVGPADTKPTKTGIAFMPVYSDTDESYIIVPTTLSAYEFVGEKPIGTIGGTGSPYISLSVFEGSRANQGSPPEEEPMAA